MLDADFLDDEIPFCSNAYRIDAMFRFGLCLEAIDCERLSSAKLRQADTALANWFLQLPESKRSPIDRHGNIDELLFQAHLIASGSVLLSFSFDRPLPQCLTLCQRAPVRTTSEQYVVLTPVSFRTFEDRTESVSS
jgi:hypothetical protein